MNETNCGYTLYYTSKRQGADSYAIYQEFIRLFKPSWLGGEGGGRGLRHLRYINEQNERMHSKQVQSEKSTQIRANIERQSERENESANECKY